MESFSEWLRQDEGLGAVARRFAPAAAHAATDLAFGPETGVNAQAVTHAAKFAGQAAMAAYGAARQALQTRSAVKTAMKPTTRHVTQPSRPQSPGSTTGV